jgi:hypothetical protein
MDAAAIGSLIGFILVLIIVYTISIKIYNKFLKDVLK